MKRKITTSIQKDLSRKIVLLTGPRQCGKTWLSKNLGLDHDYLSYDEGEHREIIGEKSWDRKKPLIILDELHKMPDWKRFLKGLYDVEGVPPGLLITGSARLDINRKMGDSLAGRFFQHRLHPFDVRELADQMEPQTVLERILQVGGFPEPFLLNDPDEARRWRKTHLDVILRQDLLDLITVSDIHALTLLVDLLRRNVGSPLSLASLGRDLQKDAKTIKRWLQILEDLYVVFPVRPYHRNIARAILKEPKYYFYDVGQLPENPALRLENAVAASLLKEIHRREDQDGRSRQLCYVRSRDGKELDFALVQEASVTHLIEVKWKDDNLSPSFPWLRDNFPEAQKVQLVYHLNREKSWPTGESLEEAAQWLSTW